MSIFEFDAEKEWKLIREAEYRYGVEIGTERGIEIGTERGIEIGTERGMMKNLIKIFCKKLVKGKTPEVIAEELEEDLDKVKRICTIAGKYAPDYNEEKILKELELLK